MEKIGWTDLRKMKKSYLESREKGIPHTKYKKVDLHYNLFICKYTIYFRRHNNMIYLLNFNATYIIILLHVSTLMSHLQSLISRTIVHIVLQFLCLTYHGRIGNNHKNTKT